MLLVVTGKCSVVFAQIKGYTVTNIGSQQGLPSSEISALYEDNNGFIWVGTNAGFSRYDGYSFENFQYINNQRIGLVYKIKETADKKLWICSESGLFVFENNKLRNIELSRGKNIAPIFDLAESFNGVIYLATADGIYKIPKKDRDNFIHGSAQISDLKINIIGDSLRGDKKIIRYLSINHKDELLLASANQVYYHIGGKTIKLWEPTETGDDVNCVYIDSTGSCHWGTALRGVNSWLDGKLRYFDESNTKGLYGAYSFCLRKNKLVVYSAVNILDFYPDQERFETKFSIYLLNIKWNTVMLIDSHENYWLGSHEGLFLIRKNPFNLYNAKSQIPLNEVYSINQFSDGKLVAGTNRGFLYEISPDSAAPYLNKQAVFPRAEVFTSYEEKPGTIWFGSGYQGLSRWKKAKLVNYRVNDGVADNTVRQITRDSKNRLWAVGDNGLTEIITNPINDSVRFHSYPLNVPNGMDIQLFKAISGPDNHLWIAGSKGVFVFSGDRFTNYVFDKRFPSEIFCNYILLDKKGAVWICSSDYGILKCFFDERNNLQVERNFNINDGLSANTFISATVDNNNVLWAVSYSGVSCIQLSEQNNYRIKNFNKKDGIDLPNYYHPSLFTDKDNRIWMSSSSGMVSFDPKELLQKNHSTSVFITKLDVGGKDGSRNIYEKGDVLNSIAAFPYDQNNISIHFTALHYENPEALHYYYRVVNKDSAWVELRNSRSVSFRSLSPGQYRFEVKGAVNGNEFGPITSYVFNIEPPFWRKSWFVIPVILLFSFLSYWLIRKREGLISEREAEKTELQKLKAISYQYQLEIEQVVNYFATSMNEQKTVDDMLWDVSRNCISKLGFEDCVIYLKNPDTQKLIQKAAWGPKTTRENKIVNPIEIAIGQGIVGTVAKTGKAEIINDTSIDSRYIVDDVRRLSEITVPIVEKGETVGVIDSEHSQKNFYTGRHLQILSTIASLLGEKIDKMKAEQNVREREIQLITLNRDLATSQLTALRAQMNPHFIFNALNSIQQYILKGDVDQAHKYLSKFSKLQREVLNHCDQNFISLDKEIEMLNLYLELEQLRFNGNFTYQIILDNEIDPAEISIPPMILQPFVENAIWHGLMPKKSDRQLQIEFSLRSDELIQCIVRDNGIGRAAAAKLKEEKNLNQTPYKSKGLQLVHERLDILRQQYNQPFEVQFTDLTNPAGEVQGTSVSLILYIGSPQ